MCQGTGPWGSGLIRRTPLRRGAMAPHQRRQQHRRTPSGELSKSSHEHRRPSYDEDPQRRSRSSHQERMATRDTQGVQALLNTVLHCRDVCRDLRPVPSERLP
jgi:hypothetical protein